MKIIFLDVDGVLNSVRSMIAYHDEYRDSMVQQDHYSFDSKHHLLRNHIDLVAVKLLNRVTDETGAKYVISSTHRKHIPCGADGKRNIFTMKKYFAGFGLTGEVIGYTPCHQDGFRGREIEAWINTCRPEHYPSHYAIVDDSDDMTPYQLENHFVHTSVDDGFSLQNYKELRYLLGIEDSESSKPRIGSTKKLGA